MWQGQPLTTHLHPLQRHKIYINQSVNISPLCIAMRSRRDAPFSLLKAVKNIQGSKISFYSNSQIEKSMLALKSPRLTLLKRRTPSHASQGRFNKSNGTLYLGVPIANIASYVEIGGSHRVFLTSTSS